MSTKNCLDNKRIILKPNQTLMEFLIENKDKFDKNTSVLIEDEKELEKYDVSVIKNPYSYGRLYDEKEYGKLLTSKDGKNQMTVIRIYHGVDYGVPRAKYYVKNVNSIIKYQRMIFGDETNGYHYGITLPDDVEYIDYIKHNISNISKNSLKVKRSIIEDPEKYTFVRKIDGKRGDHTTVYTPNNENSGNKFISICNTLTSDPNIRFVKNVIENLSISTELFQGEFPFRNNTKFTLADEMLSTPNDVM